MKKAISLVLALVVCIGLCACGEKTTQTTKQDATFLVTFSDGSTDRVTTGQMIRFPSKYNLASIELTGRINSIMKEYGSYSITLENGIEILVVSSFVENSNIDIGNYVTVNGKMIVTDYSITVGQPTKEKNSIEPFDYITFVE